MRFFSGSVRQEKVLTRSKEDTCIVWRELELWLGTMDQHNSKILDGERVLGKPSCEK